MSGLAQHPCSSPPAPGWATGFHEGLRSGPCPESLSPPVSCHGQPQSVPCSRSRTTGLIPWRELLWTSDPSSEVSVLGKTQKSPLGRTYWCQSLTPWLPHTDWLYLKMEAWVASCSLLYLLPSPRLPFRAGGDKRHGFSEGLLDEGEWEQVLA